MERKEFYIEQPGYTARDGYVLRLVIRDTTTGKAYTPEPLVLKEAPEASYLNDLMVMQREDLQHLMDQLWACGIRPAEAKYNTEAFKSIQYHLEDMRKLVFDK